MRVVLDLIAGPPAPPGDWPPPPWRAPGVSPIDWERTPLRKRLALWMLAHLGLQPETEGENRGPWVRFFLRGDDGLKWCAASVLTGIVACGGQLPRVRIGGLWVDAYWPWRKVSTWWRWARKNGRSHPPLSTPKIGWLAVWRNHINVVTAVDELARTFDTVGGNERDSIRRVSGRKLDTSGHLGFIEVTA